MTGFDVARRRPLSESVAGRCFPTLWSAPALTSDKSRAHYLSLAVQCESQLEQETMDLPLIVSLGPQ